MTTNRDHGVAVLDAPLTSQGHFEAAVEALRFEPKIAGSPIRLEQVLEHTHHSMPATTVLELSARHPYDASALIDGYHVGRWDATSDTIYMSPIVQTGPSVGEWDGTALYGRFTPPTSGPYAVVATFYGFQITMSLNGPWGTVQASSVNNAPTAAVAHLTATAGQAFGFTMACRGLYLGFLQKIQLVKL